MLFLVDGFDEIQADITRAVLIEILNNIALKSPKSNFIITSRESASLPNFSNTKSYELNFFKEDQLD